MNHCGPTHQNTSVLMRLQLWFLPACPPPARLHAFDHRGRLVEVLSLSGMIRTHEGLCIHPSGVEQLPEHPNLMCGASHPSIIERIELATKLSNLSLTSFEPVNSFEKELRITLTRLFIQRQKRPSLQPTGLPGPEISNELAHLRGNCVVSVQAIVKRLYVR